MYLLLLFVVAPRCYQRSLHLHLYGQPIVKAALIWHLYVYYFSPDYCTSTEYWQYHRFPYSPGNWFLSTKQTLNVTLKEMTNFFFLLIDLIYKVSHMLISVINEILWRIFDANHIHLHYPLQNKFIHKFIYWKQSINNRIIWLIKLKYSIKIVARIVACCM